MKTIISFIIAIALFNGASAVAQQITNAELQVNGLTCSMCSRATETSLKTLGFIEKVTPDLNRNIFVLTFKKDQRINIDQIRQKVQDAGFSIGDLSATINFKKASVDASGIVQSGNAVYKIVNAKEKTLDGPVTAKILDKGFVSNPDFKKNVAKLKSDTYQTGKGVVNGRETRIFHLSI